MAQHIPRDTALMLAFAIILLALLSNHASGLGLSTQGCIQLGGNVNFGSLSLQNQCQGTSAWYGVGIGWEVTPVGTCTFWNYSYTVTCYPAAGDGLLVNVPLPVTSPKPVTAQILYDNFINSPYLITCPNQPNPSNTIEYIEDPGTFIGGDRCLANSVPLITIVELKTTMTWKCYQYGWTCFALDFYGSGPGESPVSAQQSWSVQHMAEGTLTALAYSGETQNQGSSAYNISNNYDSQSYIFQGMNSSNQNGLWTWDAKYANLANTYLPGLDLNKTFSNIKASYLEDIAGCTKFGYLCLPFDFHRCTYTYNYSVHSWVNSIMNTNVVIPAYNSVVGSNNYLIAGDYKYSPVATVTDVGSASGGSRDPSCTSRMWNGGLGCDGWIKVGYNATANYDGAITYNAPLYLHLIQNSNINAFTKYWGYWQGQMIGSCDPFVQPFGNNKFYIPADAVNPNGNIAVEVADYVRAEIDAIGASEGVSYSPCSDGWGDHGCGTGCIANSEGADFMQVCGSMVGGTSYPCGNWGAVIQMFPNPLIRVNIQYLVPVSGTTDTFLESSTFIPDQSVPFINVSIMPSFRYNVTVPAPYAQFSSASYLNASLDVYSPNNYAGIRTIDNNQLNYVEPYTLDTGAGLIGNFTNTQVGGDVVGVYPYNFASYTGNIPSYLYIPSTIQGPADAHGTLGFMTIHNPESIAESPNGYIYILNYTSNTHGIITKNTHTVSYLFRLKYLPVGDFNYSGYPLSSWSNEPSSAAWVAQSKDYFEASLLAHTPSLFIVNQSQVTDTKYINGISAAWYNNWIFKGYSKTSSSGQLNQPFNPLAIATDYGGDIFIVGANTVGATGSGVDWGIATINNNGMVTTNVIMNQPSGFVPSQEFAASPGGKYFYLANYSSGQINIYDAQTDRYLGDISLSYSNRTYNMNIIAYLAHGGPWNNGPIASYYSGAGAGIANDVQSNHHPISIADVNGTLYVIDDWILNNPNNPITPYGAIWMLRAFRNNSIEVPMDPSMNKTSAPVSAAVAQSLGLSVAGSIVKQGIPLNGWPPYGWPLTENISVPNGNQNGFYAVCEDFIRCPISNPLANFSYPPIGPWISLSYDSWGMLDHNGYMDVPSISSDFNGNLYMLANDLVSSQSPYTELAIIHAATQNYTSVALGERIPFVCYDSATDTLGGGAQRQGLSTGTDNGNSHYCSYVPAISALSPPLVGMPDAFRYDTAMGIPNQYYSLGTEMSTLFPTGVNTLKYSQSANSEFKNGIVGANTINYNTLATTQLGGPQPTVNAISGTFLNSTISGYVMTPYMINYELTQKYSYQDPGTDDGGIGDVQNFQTPCIWKPKNPGASNVVTFTFAITPLGTGFINQTIEGGGTYLTDAFNNQSYNANLTDKGLIVPPYLSYRIFSDRLFGEIYINQTIGPKTALALGTAGSVTGALKSLGISFDTSLSNPMLDMLLNHFQIVVNATRNYNYKENFYEQLAPGLLLGGGTGFLPIYGGYTTQTAIPTGTTPNDTIVSAECTGSCIEGLAVDAGLQGLVSGSFPSNFFSSPQNFVSSTLGIYYYSLAGPFFDQLGGKSRLNYTIQSKTQYFTLDQLYRRVNYVYNLDLNMSGSDKSLGYNRLMYTYVDRFNNTIYMPLDIDLANITTINLTATSTVNSLNFNQSEINIRGSLDYISANGIVPAPAGSTLYLYYDANINYYNSNLGLPFVPYEFFSYGIKCAFAPTSTGCKIADPLNYFGLSPQNTIILQTEAAIPDYHPDYASGGGSCNKPPTSLLLGTVYNCNINGGYLPSSSLPQGLLPASKLPSTTTNLANGQFQYCVPQFINGTGILTSQLGLIGTVQTDSNGQFSYNTIACGVGIAHITAQYYGYPPPEPIQVAQTALPHSAIIYSANPANDTVAPEYNYYYSPNATVSTVQIGSYGLDLGYVYAWAPLIVILILIFAARASTGQTGSIFELFGFGVLYDYASGIMGGKTGKGLLKTKYPGTKYTGAGAKKLTDIKKGIDKTAAGIGASAAAAKGRPAERRARGAGPASGGGGSGRANPTPGRAQDGPVSLEDQERGEMGYVEREEISPPPPPASASQVVGHRVTGWVKLALPRPTPKFLGGRFGKGEPGNWELEKRFTAPGRRGYSGDLAAEQLAGIALPKNDASVIAADAAEMVQKGKMREEDVKSYLDNLKDSDGNKLDDKTRASVLKEFAKRMKKKGP